MNEKIQRPVHVIADELDRYVERHEGFLNETAAYDSWAAQNLSPSEAAEARREWYHSNRRVLDEISRLKEELRVAIERQERSAVHRGVKAHPLETDVSDPFPAELIHLDPMYSDPAHFFSAADKRRAAIIRNSNDEIAKRRSSRKIIFSDPIPRDPRPSDPRPSDTIPRDPRPSDTIPRDPSPRDTIPRDPRPRDPIPRDPRPSDPIPSDPIPRDPRPSDPRPGDTRPSDTRPEL